MCVSIWTSFSMCKTNFFTVKPFSLVDPTPFTSSGDHYLPAFHCQWPFLDTEEGREVNKSICVLCRLERVRNARLMEGGLKLRVSQAQCYHLREWAIRSLRWCVKVWITMSQGRKQVVKFYPNTKQHKVNPEWLKKINHLGSFKLSQCGKHESLVGIQVKSSVCIHRNVHVVVVVVCS